MAKKKEKKYMFLCDRKRDCCKSPTCGTTCRHTADYKHYKNEVHKKFMRDASDPTLYWEWEVEE